MDSLSPQVVFAAKLPILNPNEFDLWKIRIEQYFLMTDYSLWEVILNGNSPAPTRVVEGVLQPVASTTAEQKLAKKNELKARGTLLIALPEKHQLKFNSHKDTKTLMEAIKKRFGRNTETKKVQKTILKQEYENFTGTTTQNLAFMSSSTTDNTTESVSAAASVSAVCAKMLVSFLPNVDSLSNMAMLTMKARRFLQMTGRNLGANGPTSLSLICIKWSVITATGRDILQRSVGSYDWSFQAEEEPANYALMTFLSSSSSSDNEFDVISYQTGLESVEARLLVYKQNESIFKEDIKLLKLEAFCLDVETSIPAATPNLASPKPTSNGKRRNRKAYFVCKSLDHLIKDYDYHEKKMAKPTVRNHAHMGNHKHYAPMTHQNPQKHKVPASVLTQSKPVSITVVRPVSTVVPKIKVTRPKQVQQIVTKPKSPIRRNITRSPSPKTSNSPPRVTVVKALVVNDAQGLQGKLEWRPKCPILNHGNPQHALKDKGVIDSGCSRHMTGNMSYLSDFKELNGGYVAFGELKLNLFSVSQMCDKKNIFLFTDTECLVLSPDFKLPDESQVLLRFHRENNMYKVNLKNIVPSGDLTCLFAKATIDESNLWHRRLGHINFKTMNKLVKGNLLEDYQQKFLKMITCVACKKGKQHRASCKTKHVSSINQPLYRLHMDLFGPTFVKSLNKKSYCLVVTDYYSRFTWVFFLVTKDETTPILKTFLTGLENQLSLKQNSIAERKNRTLIEAARTMLTDSLLPIPFWAEAVNTACYVQNRVLVTKHHNKTPYEHLHGRTPSIGFMRPFGCLMTILNTLDSLRKCKGKVDERFLVGYSVSSKAFRVFNSRTRIVQETLHVNFIENHPNITGSGPTWLFDIDSLTNTMNYQPVTAVNQSNHSVRFQDKFDAKKAREEGDQQYVIFLVWSSGSTNPQNNDGDVAFVEKELDFDAKKHESEVIVSPSSSAQSRKQDDKTKKEAKGKSLVESFTGYIYLSANFEDYSDNSINEINAARTLVPTVGQISSNGTNTISACGPSNAAASQTHGKSSFIDASQLPDDPDMSELEDISYSYDENNVGAEADFTNLETSITVSPISTTRVHKDHPATQIIGDLSSVTQTRSMTRVAKDQGGLSQMFNDYFHTSMQEELLQFKMQKVWVLVDLPYGKRAIGHTQEEGIDYEEVFSPVARIKAIRLFLAYASFMSFMVYQMDVKSAFLYGTIEEEVYVCQPPGFEDPDHLTKSAKRSRSNNVYQKAEKGYSAGSDLLKQKKDEIFISQDKYVAKILRKFGLTEGKSASTPIDTEKPLLKDPDGKDIDVHTYRSTIGSLMYLTSSKPDIMFAVCACACFQVTPKASHLHAVKRIFRYLKGKLHLGLWYLKDSPFDLVAYSDSDYAGTSLD
nr:hypothetical protein [Tanacetum cinerariifolium]